MTDITIPPEAVEAAARAVHDIDRKIAGDDQWPAWEELSPMDQRRRTHRATAALRAGIAAWPGSFPHTFHGPLEGYGYVLPLPPKENSNAEA